MNGRPATIEEDAAFKSKVNGETESADLLAQGFWAADAAITLDLPSLVKGILCRGDIAVLWGAPGSGKSFNAIELAMAIGAGERWKGRRTSRGVVLYVAAESTKKHLQNRVAALKREWPAVAASEVFIVPLALDLLHQQRGDVDRVINTAKVLSAQIGEVVLIVVDTLAVTFGGGNENAPEDMGLYVGNIQIIRAQTGAAILIVHHSGKDEAKGMRGHTALLAALDAELAIEGTPNGERILRTGKVRDGEGYTDLFAFTLRPIELGIDTDGDPVRTCVVDALGGEALVKARRETKGMGKSQRAIVDLLDRHGSMSRPELVEKLKAEYSMSKSASQHAITGLAMRNGISNIHGLLSLS